MANNNNSSIEWGEPPESTHQGPVWPELCAALREKPGEWGLMRRYPKPHSAASQRRQVERKYGNDGEYEFVNRIITEGGKKIGVVYGRYTGKK